MNFITLKVRAISRGEAYWEHEATVSDGECINLNIDKAMGALVAERNALHAFVTSCAGKAGMTVEGDKLAKAAIKLLAAEYAPAAIDVEVTP